MAGSGAKGPRSEVGFDLRLAFLSVGDTVSNAELDQDLSSVGDLGANVELKCLEIVFGPWWN